MKRHWFLPYTPDLLGRLLEQSEITVNGIDAFVQWSGGDLEQNEAVRKYEHDADLARRHLLKELRAAFSTPLDPEDIYELSERLDAVLNGAKNAVRESEVMKHPAGPGDGGDGRPPADRGRPPPRRVREAQVRPGSRRPTRPTRRSTASAISSTATGARCRS